MVDFSDEEKESGDSPISNRLNNEEELYYIES